MNFFDGDRQIGGLHAANTFVKVAPPPVWRNYASKSYMGKSEDCSHLENKPGRYWGVIGRSNVKLGKREVHEITAEQAFRIQRIIRRYRRANTAPEKRKFSRRDRYSSKLYCDVENWMSCFSRLDAWRDTRQELF